MSTVGLACAACGWPVPPDAPRPFACAHRGRDDADHLIEHRLAPELLLDAGDDPNPFVRWRRGLWAWHAAQRRGIDDAAFVARVRHLDDRIAAVDGHGFRTTPWVDAPRLGQRLGLDLRIKDETGNVAGSHKARHLMGLLLHLDVADPDPGAPLAIASCGNAALAAAVLARAAGRELQVCVPPDAEPAVLARLHGLGASVITCARAAGEAGDPCLHRFRQALAAGALPFCCQGSENGLAIDGGQTLMLEIIAAAGAPLDDLVVQVGGGALASACAQACARAIACGLLQRLPRIHTVQTRGAAPLARAWRLVCERAQSEGQSLAAALDYAAQHRSEFMWPWEGAPHSIASGIVDDETYDWHAVLRGMAASGGSSLVVDEATLRQANALARATTGGEPSHTGTAGLAGLLQLQRQGVIAKGARVGLLWTGVQR